MLPQRRCPRVKRSGVRTRTLGLGWEERFLAAVQKARAQKLIPPEGAEKLRLLAGVYLCAKCRKEHRTGSRLGKEHLRLQPAPPRTTDTVEARPKRTLRGRKVDEDAALPVALVEGAKAGGKRRTKLEPRDEATLARTRAAAERAAEAAKPKGKRR